MVAVSTVVVVVVRCQISKNKVKKSLSYESNFRLVYILCISSKNFKMLGHQHCLFPTITCLSIWVTFVTHLLLDVTHCYLMSHIVTINVTVIFLVKCFSNHPKIRNILIQRVLSILVLPFSQPSSLMHLAFPLHLDHFCHDIRFFFFKVTSGWNLSFSGTSCSTIGVFCYKYYLGPKNDRNCRLGPCYVCCGRLVESGLA